MPFVFEPGCQMKENNAMSKSTLRTMFARAAFIAVTLAVAPSFAQEANVPQGQETNVPQPVAEHEARAQVYTNRAAQYRQEAEEHKQLAREYANKPTGRGKNPWSVKMEKHCLTIARDFEKLATDEQKAADYHLMRAKEMQGK